MDCQNYITESAERKKGQHLQREKRGAIQFFTVRVSNLHL